MYAQLRACNACRSVHNRISCMGCEMPSHNIGLPARVHRLWSLSEEGEGSAYAATAGSLGICAPSVPTFIWRLGSTSLLALAEGGAAGVAGQDKGTGGRQVRVDGEGKRKLWLQP